MPITTTPARKSFLARHCVRNSSDASGDPPPSTARPPRFKKADTIKNNYGAGGRSGLLAYDARTRTAAQKRHVPLSLEASIHLDSTLPSSLRLRTTTQDDDDTDGDAQRQRQSDKLKNSLSQSAHPPSYLSFSGPLRRCPRLQPDRHQHLQALSRRGRKGTSVVPYLFVLHERGCHPLKPEIKHEQR